MPALSEIAPPEPSGKEGLVRCQLDRDGLDLVGLPKLDLPGLKTHTPLDNAARMVSKRLGRNVDPLLLPRDYMETYRTIRRGDVPGVRPTLIRALASGWRQTGSR